eukprot:109438_1
MLLILTCFISIVLSVQFQEPAWYPESVCHGPQQPFYDCTRDGCNENKIVPRRLVGDDDIVLAEELCQDLGDGVPRCYWVDPNVIFWGDNSYEHRICTWHGDAECLYLDG